MKNEKKSFVIYDEWAKILQNLPDESAGLLIKTMCAWKLGEDCPTDDPMILAIFSGIRPQMERDTEAWEATKRKRSEAGKKGANARWMPNA